jgi:hypothetical protein
MALEICGRAIDTVAIIDDQADVREVYSYRVENAELTPVPQDGPLGNSVLAYLERSGVATSTDAGLCDFKLNGTAYATFSGAELAAALYQRNFPVLLCTRWEKISLPEIAPFRRWIPSLMTPSDLNEESLIKGIGESIYELDGNFRPNRRPWRTQVHFLQAEDEYNSMYSAEIPGWELDEVVKIRLIDLPDTVRSRVVPDFRCYAHVNLGAEAFEDLYWSDWELA